MPSCMLKKESLPAVAPHRPIGHLPQMPKSGIWGRKNFVLAEKDLTVYWNSRKNGCFSWDYRIALLDRLMRGNYTS